MELIQVHATSSVPSVAGAIASVVLEYHQADVQAVGREAVNQAIQALALAACSLKSDGILITCVHQFSRVILGNKVRTAIKIRVRLLPSSRFSSMGLSTSPARAELSRV